MTETIKGDVQAAQNQWAQAIVEIGQLKQAGGEYKTRAFELIDDLYDYESGTVLFKPTLAAQKRFRTTKESALSYFVGSNPDFPEDSGFALRPWKSVSFDSCEIAQAGDVIMTMGSYSFTDLDDRVTIVDYSFAYVRDASGKLRIKLHHSSLPHVNSDRS